MMTVFDTAQHRAAFRPANPDEFFALRLAQKLNDGPSARHYIHLSQQHHQRRLLAVLRRTTQNAHPGEDLGRRFLSEMARTPGNGGTHGNEPAVKLLSVRVERRTIAAVVFHGDHIEYTEARHLSSVRDKALASAAGFVNWLVSSLPVESAAIESVPDKEEILRRQLKDIIVTSLRDQMLPIWEVEKQKLFEAFGYPALRSRHQLRETICGIWPVDLSLNNSPTNSIPGLSIQLCCLKKMKII
ncbi:MAG: hypothetical protein SFV18_18305 [Bryobacteraceae bacterium]|nr:hypothetical protein [Bryobacteraceae bacterium]